MDLHQIEYMLEIARTKNISRASEHLGISQSALNQQLLKQEENLDVQLFHRQRGAWSLTKAGEIYMDAARRIVDIRDDAYSQIASIVQSEKTELVLGLTTGRGISMFVELYPKLHALFPHTKITPLESTVKRIQTGIADGSVDIGFITLQRKLQTNDAYIQIAREEMVALVPRTRSFCNQKYTGKGLSEISIQDIKDESFVLMYQQSTIRNVCDDLFEKAGIRPNIAMETSSTPSMQKIAYSMDCCALVPRYYADLADPHYETFVLKEHPFWMLYISYRRGAYLDAASKAYIQLVKEYWEKNKNRISCN